MWNLSNTYSLFTFVINNTSDDLQFSNFKGREIIYPAAIWCFSKIVKKWFWPNLI